MFHILRKLRKIPVAASIKVGYIIKKADLQRIDIHERENKMKKNLQTRFSTRQYMLSRDFEIYYYKDYELSKVDSHTHDYYEFYFFLEGDMSLVIAGKAYPLQYGDVVVIPPGTAHRAVIQSAEVPYRRFVFWITGDYLSRMMELSPAYGYLMQYVQTKREYIFHNDQVSFNAIQTKVLRLIDETRGNRFGREAKVSLCVSDLVLHLNRTVYERKHEKNPREEQTLYESLTDYIEEHLDEELSLETLAGRFYVSKFHISHIFKDHIGISVHQYIQKKRLEACRDAIRSGTKITEAYLMYGFRDYSGFFRAFKKEYGMSPKEWMEMNKT